MGVGLGLVIGKYSVVPQYGDTMAYSAVYINTAESKNYSGSIKMIEWSNSCSDAMVMVA